MVTIKALDKGKNVGIIFQAFDTLNLSLLLVKLNAFFSMR